MFAVISCKKFHRQTLRIADFGDTVKTVDQAQAMLNKYPGAECPVCGPCSHVELGWSGYLVVHSVHTSESGAIDAAVALDESSPDQYKLEVPV